MNDNYDDLPDYDDGQDPSAMLAGDPEYAAWCDAREREYALSDAGMAVLTCDPFDQPDSTW